MAVAVSQHNDRSKLLKLTRVREALCQAVANQAFADESVVALPIEVAK